MVRTYFQVVVQINAIYGFVCLIYITFPLLKPESRSPGEWGGEEEMSFFIYIYKK